MKRVVFVLLALCIRAEADDFPIEFPNTWPRHAVDQMLNLAGQHGYTTGTYHGRPVVFVPGSTPVAQTRPPGAPLQMHTSTNVYSGGVTPYHNFFGLGGVNGGVLDNHTRGPIYHSTLADAMNVPRARSVIFDPELWDPRFGTNPWNLYEVYYHRPPGTTSAFEWVTWGDRAQTGAIGGPFRPSIVVVEHAPARPRGDILIENRPDGRGGTRPGRPPVFDTAATVYTAGYAGANAIAHYAAAVVGGREGALAHEVLSRAPDPITGYLNYAGWAWANRNNPNIGCRPMQRTLDEAIRRDVHGR